MLSVITPATTSDLTVLATVKEEMRITDDGQDTYIARLISEVSDILAEACNVSTFGRETVQQTERLQKAVDCIFLDRDINPEIASVTVDGTALADTDYEVDEFRLYLLDNDTRVCWSSGTKVQIDYDAGFELLATLPRTIERACLSLVVSTMRARGRDSKVSRVQTEGVGSVSFFDAAAWQQGFPPDVQAVVDRWRRKSV